MDAEKQKRLNEVVAYLTGSCQSMEAAGALPADLDDREFLQGIDENIFECVTCGWWYEIEEAVETDDGHSCPQCKESM